MLNVICSLAISAALPELDLVVARRALVFVGSVLQIAAIRLANTPACSAAV